MYYAEPIWTNMFILWFAYVLTPWNVNLQLGNEMEFIGIVLDVRHGCTQNWPNAEVEGKPTKSAKLLNEKNDLIAKCNYFIL